MGTEGVGPMSVYRHIVEERYGFGARYEAALNLMTAERSLAATIDEVLREHGLTRPQWSVLTIVHLAPADQIPLGRMAQALGVHGTTITNALDRLIDLGLAERVIDANDRRSVFATITDEGAARVDAIMTRLAEQQFGLADLSDSDLKALARVLRKISPLP